MNKKSFSLIELIAAMAVLAIGLTSIILVLRFTSTAITQSYSNTIENFLCEERLEEGVSMRRNSGFASIPTGTFNENPINGFPDYNRETQVYYVNLNNLNTQAPGPTNYKKVKVTVTSSGSAPLAMETVVANY